MRYTLFYYNLTGQAQKDTDMEGSLREKMQGRLDRINRIYRIILE